MYVQCPSLNWIANNRINQILKSDIDGPIIPQKYTKYDVNRIIRLLLSLLCWPQVILLSGGHCIEFLIFKNPFRIVRQYCKKQNKFKSCCHVLFTHVCSATKSIFEVYILVWATGVLTMKTKSKSLNELFLN